MSANRFQHYLSIALIFGVVGMLAWLSDRYIATADWTANSRNTLTEQSIKLLDSMPDAIRFKVFIYPDKNLKRDIQARLDLYQREKDNIEIDYIDPAKDPVLAREMGVASSGEVFIEYQGRSESLRALSEQTITTALQRLAYSGERVIRFLEGHGERRADSQNQTDYGFYAEELRNKGFKVEGLNLAKTGKVPEDTSVVVIASPTSKPLAGEIKLLREYAQGGGNVLWLADPGQMTGLEPLAEALAIEWQTGTVIYPDFQILGTAHPAVLLVLDYPDHAITSELFENTVLPFAGAVMGIKDSGWNQQPFLTSLERSWLETGKLDGDLSFSEEDGEQLGPFMLGVAMHRELDKDGNLVRPPATPEEAQQEKDSRHQRAVVIADSDFLANGYVDNLGNMQLGINIMQWLSHSDEQISIHIPPAPDNKLYLSAWAPTFYGIAFVLVAPILFLVIGVGRWWIRKRR
ncbi:MAG: GldG family protein [Nevskiales bacterium]